MRNSLSLFSGLVIVLAMVGCAATPRQSGTLYQVSTLQGLMAGAYDGAVTFGELRRHGDTGIGTLQGLDGEMILLDGRAWQARADGRVVPVADAQATPFATVAMCSARPEVCFDGQMDFAELIAALDERLPTRNTFYMARLDGRFSYVKTRSVPAQAQPYPLLIEASKRQSIFERRDVSGTLVALRCPPYATGINMAGWHMHFLSSDRQFGGHVLEVRADRCRARIARLDRLEIVLPRRGRFVEADLMRVTEKDVHAVEK